MLLAIGHALCVVVRTLHLRHRGSSADFHSGEMLTSSATMYLTEYATTTSELYTCSEYLHSAVVSESLIGDFYFSITVHVCNNSSFSHVYIEALY